MAYFGIDLHSKHSEVCGLSETGEKVMERRVSTTESGLRRIFAGRARSRVVIEASGAAPWVRRLLRQMGHEVVVVNPRRVRLIAESTLKSDRVDAEVLARLGRLGDDFFLRPVYQRSRAAQLLRTRLRARSNLVKLRTALINSVRGSLRAHGYRMTGCTARTFAVRFGELDLAEDLLEALEPLVETIVELTARIDRLEAELVEESRADELLARLQEVPGVGPMVSLAFVSWMDRPQRFRRSREVGACLGLRPRVRDSAGVQRRGSITREGDVEMRRLLVQAAHCAMRCRRDTALKRWAEQLAERAGKKKAVVALARKIAVLLHHLWVTGARYQPFPAPASNSST